VEIGGNRDPVQRPDSASMSVINECDRDLTTTMFIRSFRVRYLSTASLVCWTIRCRSDS
jgi:hypothetical protein